MQKTIFSEISSEQLSNKIVQRAKDQISRDIGGEAVILNLTSGKYYGLNEIGARIWEFMEKPVSIRDICDKLLEEYEVSVDRCEKELLAILQDMADHDLIELKNGKNS